MSQQDYNELRDALTGTATAKDTDHGAKATAAEAAYNKFKSYLTKEQQADIGAQFQLIKQVQQPRILLKPLMEHLLV